MIRNRFSGAAIALTATLALGADSPGGLETRVSVEYKSHRLEAVLTHLSEQSGVEIDGLWHDDTHETGLDKDATITLKATNLSAARVLERVLAQADRPPKDRKTRATWQAEGERVIAGPRERLNDFTTTRVYEVADLLMVIPDWANSPEFDMQAVLQSSGRGGSSQSPFRPISGRRDDENRLTRAVRADNLIKLIVEFVEPDQWEDQGGDSAMVREHQGTLIVRAPGYVHRALGQ